MARRSNSAYPYLATHWDNIYAGNAAGMRFLADHAAAVTWDDLRAPATAINPPGAVSDPDIDSTTGHFLFDKNSTETLIVFFQMPHNLVRGIPVSVHVHWIKEAAGTVVWQLEHKLYSLNAEYPGSYTTTTTTHISADYGDVSPAVDVQVLSAFPRIATAALTGVSAMLECKISRLGGDASDDYDQDARFVEADCHVAKIGHGSTGIDGGDYTTADLGGG